MNTITPFYFDRSPSKAIQNHYKENGGVKVYMSWKRKMTALSDMVIQVFGQLQDSSKSTQFGLAKALTSTSESNREMFLDALRKSFAYLANDSAYTSYSDPRNTDAVNFIKLVSATEYTPDFSYQDALNDASLNKNELSNDGVESVMGDLFTLLLSGYTGEQYTSDNLAEVLIAEYSRNHNTHQQNIARNLHGAFHAMHTSLEEEVDTATAWALRAGRANVGFIYI